MPPLLDERFWQDIRQGLTDAGNRGIVGGTLGMPVDLAAGVINAALMSGGYLGNKLGLLTADQMPQPIEHPVGGSEWLGQKMQDAGMVSGNRNPVAETLMGLLGPSAISKGGQAAWAMEQNAAKPSLLNAATRDQLGAIVYHGSPHKFDKFDMSKIGTGEGAQAYGHGMYFADEPGVAKSYQNALTDLYPNGVRPKAGSAEDRAAAYAASEIDSQAQYPHISAAQKAQRFLESSDPQKKEIIDTLNEWHRSGTEFKRAGALYKVDLPDEHIAKMLDWDKPLSQQPKSVLRALKAADVINPKTGRMYPAADLGGSASGNMTGGSAADVYRALARQWDNGYGPDALINIEAKNGQEAATQYLRSLGIPGIRYLDAGSRGTGKGSSNYVVFDDQLPTIVGRE